MKITNMCYILIFSVSLIVNQTAEKVISNKGHLNNIIICYIIITIILIILSIFPILIRLLTLSSFLTFHNDLSVHWSKTQDSMRDRSLKFNWNDISYKYLMILEMLYDHVLYKRAWNFTDCLKFSKYLCVKYFFQ